MKNSSKEPQNKDTTSEPKTHNIYDKRKSQKNQKEQSSDNPSDTVELQQTLTQPAKEQNPPP